LLNITQVFFDLLFNFLALPYCKNELDYYKIKYTEGGDNMDIGGFLKFKRQERELTQKDVADAVGVSEGTVSRWESGKIGNMRRDKIEALAKILDMDPTIITRGKYGVVFDKAGGLATGTDSAAAADGAVATSAAALTGAGIAAAASAAVGSAGAVVAASPVLVAIDALASAATSLSKLIGTSLDTNSALPTEFTEEERQMIEDYRTLSDSDKQTIQLMIRSLKEKNTIASSDAIPEEG
jgi:transcriptional regulator with XRE-family HTH domain